MDSLSARSGAAAVTVVTGGATSRFVYRHEDRRPRGYEPIYRSFEPSLYAPEIGLHGFLNAAHEDLPASVADIHGKLMPGDQHKLYEAAYFARGAILEVGRLHGKSTTVLAMGMRDGGAPGPLYSIELNDKYEPIARAHLNDRGLLELVTLLRGDSATVIAQLPGRFDTVFVDGDHSYAGIMRDLDALDDRIAPGGVAMFHDSFHPENERGSYGVARALAERAGAMGLAYRGRFGGMALYEQVGEAG
jgi:predicted O-methyltransferase YrrM